MWKVHKRKHILQKEVHKLQRKLPVSRAGFICDYCQSDLKNFFLQASNYHFNASPHQKLDKPTSWVSRKMQIGCRWLWPFSQNLYIGLGWKFLGFFNLVLCTCPKIMRIQLTNWKICPFQFLHFCRWTWIKMCCSWTSWTNISQNANWVGMKFFQKVSTIIMHLHTKN